MSACVEVMDDRDVVDVVERALQEAHRFERSLHLLVAGFRERNLALLFVELVVLGQYDLHHLVDLSDKDRRGLRGDPK